MDLFGLLVFAVALEAVVEILRNAWDEDTRKRWTIASGIVFVIPVVAILVWSDDLNLVSDTGLDLDNDVVGGIITALAAGRLAQWVHTFYARTRA